MMKRNKLKHILLLVICSSCIVAKAQNPVRLNPINEKSVDELNCWNLTDVFSYNLVPGNPEFNSLNTKLLDNGSKAIVSPWIKFNSSGKIQWRDAAISGLDVDKQNSKFEITRIDTNNNRQLIYTSNLNYKYGLTDQVGINFSGIFKIEFRFFGVRLTNSTAPPFSGNLGGISIDGDYWSSPSLNCTPKAIVSDDRDNDGVKNVADAFPDDPLRAFIFKLNSFTFMAEDQWPKKGDYDLNDVVAEFQTEAVANAKNYLVESFTTVITKALGGSNSNGLMFQLQNFKPDQITSVTGFKTTGSNWVDLDPNGLESNQTKANILVFDNGNAIMPNGTADNITNVELDKPFIKPDTTKIKITYKLNSTSLYAISYNPYIIANQNRGTEVHVIGDEPSDKADRSLFNTADDASNGGKYYRTSNNLPWAIKIHGKNVPWMQESKDFTTGFSKFSEWAIGNGVSYYDWYEDKPGYRDNSNLYIR